MANKEPSIGVLNKKAKELLELQKRLIQVQDQSSAEQLTPDEYGALDAEAQQEFRTALLTAIDGVCTAIEEQIYFTQRWMKVIDKFRAEGWG